MSAGGLIKQKRLLTVLKSQPNGAGVVNWSRVLVLQTEKLCPLESSKTTKAASNL